VLIKLLRAGAHHAPEEPLLVWADRALTYGDALTRSEALARGLAARAITRFGCSVVDPGDIVTLLCASSAVGAEACVYPQGLDDPTVDDYASSFEHRVIVTDGQRKLTAAEPLAIAGLPEPSRALPPVMILTTGTTGRPKGVRHDWGRLAGAVRRPDPQPGARWLLAYNLNQFAGVQILLHTLVSQATLVVPESNQPRDAVAAMHDLGVTHASATPTFWRVAIAILDETTASEIPLRQITLGGEAVPGALLGDLARLFPDARVSQVYASTELGSCASIGDGRNGLPASVLERDEEADVQFRIVDGELHARSRVGMLGYHGQDDSDDGWRPTGDLVELRGDRIHFVGRSTDVINVGGVKVHPLPIEEVVGSVAGVALVHAYGRKSPVTGEIVAVDVVAAPGFDTDDVEDAIRAACESLPVASQPRRIRFVDDFVRENKTDRRSPASAT
jgi:acyl-CoA synthetase (AMP-forming)/AMP-acid ligase II